MNVVEYIKVGDTLYSKNELQNMICSHSEELKNKLNLVITKIIHNGDRDTLEYLIEQGYKNNVINDSEQTAIHYAFYYGYDNMLKDDRGKLLFSCADDHNYKDSEGVSLFHIACELGNLPRVQKYLDLGVNVNEPCTAIVNYEHSRVETVTALHLAILNHRKEVVNLLLKNGADVNAIDSCGRTTLHLASLVEEYLWASSWEQDLEIMKIFVKYPNLINDELNFGTTPLLSIYDTNHYGALRVLNSTELSDDLETIITKNLEYDLTLRKMEKVEMLLKHGADATVTDDSGDTILHHVIDDLVPLRDPWNTRYDTFDDAIHSETVWKILTLGTNVDVNVKNNKGITPIQLAVSYMSAKIVKILLDHNADLTDLKFTYNEKNSLLYPNIAPSFECVQNLLAVIDLLSEKEFYLTLQDKMEVFKVLIHDDGCCYCRSVFHGGNDIDEIASLSSPAHLALLNFSLPRTATAELQEFLTWMDYGQFYLDHEVIYLIMEAVDEDVDPLEVPFSELDKEIACMKNTKLTESTSLYDIMMMHPYNINRGYFVNNNYEFLENFAYYRNIIKGHIAKFLIRRYVEKSAYEFLEILLKYSLQYPCYKEIIQYLMNDDIWAISCAVFPEYVHEIDDASIRARTLFSVLSKKT